MNWDKIKKDCPKASNKLLDWYGDLNDSIIRALIESAQRHLYDFFDENGIYITVDYFWDDDIMFWGYGTVDKTGLMLCPIYNDARSRKEAEEAAFTKAFEILEDKL